MVPSMTVVQLKKILEDAVVRGLGDATIRFEGWDDHGDLQSFIPRGDVRRGSNATGGQEVIIR